VLDYSFNDISSLYGGGSVSHSRNVTVWNNSGTLTDWPAVDVFSQTPFTFSARVPHPNRREVRVTSHSPCRSPVRATCVSKPCQQKYAIRQWRLLQCLLQEVPYFRCV
jgi:hypothetical protein